MSVWRISMATDSQISIFVNGRNVETANPKLRNALYRNNGDGTFTDVTEKAGVPGNGYGLGCVWGDYDNDGHPDLYVTQYGKNVLYHNNGDGTFHRCHRQGARRWHRFRNRVPYRGYVLRLRPGRISTSMPAATPSLAREPAHLHDRPRCAGQLSALRLPGIAGRAVSQQRRRHVHECHEGGEDLPAEGQESFRQAPPITITTAGRTCLSPTMASKLYLYHNEHNGTFNESALTSGIALTRMAAPWRPCACRLAITITTAPRPLHFRLSSASDHIWHNDGEGFLRRGQRASRHDGRHAAGAEFRRRLLRLRQRWPAGPVHR